MYSFAKTLRGTFFVTLGSLLLISFSPVFAQSATDSRNDFPPIFTQTPLGVNLQTGRFRYGAYDIRIGPFTARSGPNAETGFEFPGRLYWRTVIGYSRSEQPTMTVKIGALQLDFAYIGYILQGATPVPLISPFFSAATAATFGWKLQKSGSQYFVTNKEGETYVFGSHPALPKTPNYPDSDQVPLRSENADGHRIDVLHDAQARVKAFISTRGYALVYDLGATDGNYTLCGYNLTQTYIDVNSNCTASPLKARIVGASSSNGDSTTAVTDVLGNVRTFRSTVATATAPRTFCVTLLNSPVCEITTLLGALPGEALGFIKNDQVRRQTTVNGEIWDYNYINVDSIDPPPLRQVYTNSTVIDPLGRSTYATYFNGYVESIQAPDGFTQYSFAGIEPKKITYPEGNSIEFQRDSIGNLLARKENPKPNSPLPQLVVTQAFPQPGGGGLDPICFATNHKLCTKPIYRIDERGNQTDYTYDPSHGGILTETGPAVNGVRPQTRYTYAQRFAWVKSASGAFVRTATPVWVLVQKSICKAGAASGAGCAVAGDEVKTSYDYGPDAGPNNLLLRGVVVDAGGLNLRTCYGYDWRGNKVSETSPRAGLGVCP